MRYLLKILILAGLVVLGLPVAASAHGGIDHEGPVVSTIGSDAVPGATNADEVMQVVDRDFPEGPCTGFCCCQGISHCNSSCGAPSVLNDASDAAHGLTDAGAKVRAFIDRIALLDRKFGLERPPRV